jgi:hypothetical protein
MKSMGYFIDAVKRIVGAPKRSYKNASVLALAGCINPKLNLTLADQTNLLERVREEKKYRNALSSDANTETFLSIYNLSEEYEQYGRIFSVAEVKMRKAIE